MIDLSNTILEFVDGCLPECTRNKAMLVIAEIHYSVEGDDFSRKHISYFPRYLFYRPNYSTMIFYQLGDSVYPHINEDPWELVYDYSELPRNIKGFFELMTKAFCEIKELGNKHGLDGQINETIYVRKVSMLSIDPSCSANIPEIFDKDHHVKIFRNNTGKKFRFEKI